jgi:serine/threonine-protein kinase
MLSGRPPFIGFDLEDMLRQITGDEPPPLLAGAPELSAALDKVLRKALSKRPADRFATTAAFARAFHAAALASVRSKRRI